MSDILSKKYELSCVKDANGLDSYGGGVSPLWDGHWSSLLKEEYLTAIHTDIIKYDEELAKRHWNQICYSYNLWSFTIILKKSFSS